MRKPVRYLHSNGGTARPRLRPTAHGIDMFRRPLPAPLTIADGFLIATWRLGAQDAGRAHHGEDDRRGRQAAHGPRRPDGEGRGRHPARRPRDHRIEGRAPRRQGVRRPPEAGVRARQGPLCQAHHVRAAVPALAGELPDLKVREDAARRKLIFPGPGTAEIDACRTSRRHSASVRRSAHTSRARSSSAASTLGPRSGGTTWRSNSTRSSTCRRSVSAPRCAQAACPWSASVRRSRSATRRRGGERAQRLQRRRSVLGCRSEAGRPGLVRAVARDAGPPRPRTGVVIGPARQGAPTPGRARGPGPPGGPPGGAGPATPATSRPSRRALPAPPSHRGRPPRGRRALRPRPPGARPWRAGPAARAPRAHHRRGCRNGAAENVGPSNPSISSWHFRGPSPRDIPRSDRGPPGGAGRRSRGDLRRSGSRGPAAPGPRRQGSFRSKVRRRSRANAFASSGASATTSS